MTDRRRFHPTRTFMGRLLLLVIMALLLYTMLTTMLYGQVSSAAMTEIASGELHPKLKRLIQLTEAEINGSCLTPENGIQAEAVARMDAAGIMDPELLDSYALITDASGNAIYNNLMPADLSFSSILGTNLEKVIDGDVVTFSLASPRWSIDVLGVGAPIRYRGEIVGGMFLLKPQLEISAAQASVFWALMLSIIIVLLLITPFIIIVSNRISRPLRQMSDVAQSMAKGSFTARADINGGDELSQLGLSLNHMAQELSRNIDALTVERNRVLQILNGIDEGIIAFDTNGEITHSNPAVRRIFRVSSAKGDTADADDHRAAHTLRDAIPPELMEGMRGVISTRQPFTRQLVVSGGSLRVLEEGNIPPMSDSLVLLQLTVTPIADSSGATAGAVALLSDITQAERLEQTRRDYVANVSHEMRTPLTALRGLIEPLRDGMVRDDETRNRYYNIMMRETMRLSRLINDLMELSRLQSGQTSLKQERVRLEPLLDDLCEKYRSRADDSDLDFVCDIPQKLPAVAGNADRIEQVLVILLDNAMKYTPSVSADGTRGQVALRIQSTQNYVRLTVADNGIGISENDLPHIFERFYKVDKAHSGMGSGLGLSIAREIVQRMGQSLTVDSEPGKGSAFTLTLRQYDESITV